MPGNFSWMIEGQLAGMARPGCGLELSKEMMPHERRFLSWLWLHHQQSADRLGLAKRLGLRAGDAFQTERRMLEMYRKFRDIWGVLASYREGFGSDGSAVDRFEMATERLEADLEFLKEQGIDSIASMTETPLDPQVVDASGFEVVHIPVVDRAAPSQEQIDGFVRFVDARLEGGHRVVAHCLGGYGRTGTMLACYLVRKGIGSGEAIAMAREKRPGSIEGEVQEQAVAEYEERFR